MGRRYHPFKSGRFTLPSALARSLGWAVPLLVPFLLADCGKDAIVESGGPTRLAFSVQPSAATAGTAIAPAVKVEARDANNGLVTTFTGSVRVALGANPAGGTLSGTVTVTAVGGVATFADLSLNRSGAAYTLSATSGGLTAATSAPFDIEAAPASRLIFAAQPTTASAGAAITPAVQIEARDAFDNLDPNYAGDVTLAITSGTGTDGATLSGTVAVTAVAGVATFSDLSIDKSGTGYVLQATSGALANAPSAAFDIDPGPAAQLVFTVEPTTPTAGLPITPPVEVSALDAHGNVATGFTGDVTVSLEGGAPNAGAPASSGSAAVAVLSGTTTVAAVAGVATFPDLRIDQVGSGFSLAASAGSLTAASSALFDVTVGEEVTQLTFSVQPSDVMAGQPIAPAIQVSAQDGQGNTVTSFTGDVTMAIGTNPGSGTLSGTTTVAAIGGVATFDDLAIDRAGTGYQLLATSGALTSPSSAAFTVAPGAATQLAFAVQPSNTIVGTPIVPAIEVTAQDAAGNTATSFAEDITVAVTAGTGTGGASLLGTTTVAATDGVAIFADLSIDKEGVGYTLDATAAGLSAATSVAFDVAAAGGASLAFTVQPVTATAGNGTVGGTITPAVEVTALDAFGDPDPSFADVVTLAIAANPGGGVLFGGTATAVNGVARFPDLSIDKAGRGYTLQASSGALTSPGSDAFEILPGPASELAFNVQPSTETVGATITPAVRVGAVDALGNTSTDFNSGVTVAITAGTGTAGAMLLGTLTRTAIAGIATFNNLRIDLAGTGYTLSAAAPGLTGTTSAAFDIIPSEPTQLFFVVQPSTATAGDGAVGGVIAPAVEVVARDASGQTLNSFADDVTLSITPGTGTSGAALRLAGATPVTVTAGASGIALFSDLSIDRSGTGYKLTAEVTSGPFMGVTGASAFFNVDAGAPDHLAFIVQPTTTNVDAAITPQVEVAVQDILNNTVTGFASDVTLGIGTNPAGGTLSGTLTKAVVNGVAAFPDLSIDVSGIGYTLEATAMGPSAATSTAFDVAPGTANKLVFTQQATGGTAGVAMSPAFQVTARDALGNTLTGFNGDVTLTIAAGTGTTGATLSGTNTVAAANGVATFADLSIDKSGAGYRLSATAVALSGGTSTSFAITAGAAAQLDFISQPTTTAAGQTIATFQARVKDAFGNNATTFTGDVTASISENPGAGTLSGTSTVTLLSADQGVATFDDLSIDRTGTGYRLQVTSVGLSPDVSNAFAIVPGAADRLIFTVPPSDAVAGADLSPAVRVTAFDALDNVATNFADDVTLAITAGTGTGGATLDGATTVTAVNGVATFSSINIKLAGTGYRLSATAPAVTGAPSPAFDVTHGAASKLVFSVQPSDAQVGALIAPPVEVTAQDQFDNIATGFAGNVTLTIGTNPGTPPGTLFGTVPRPAVAGVATFDDLTINGAGIGYTLLATAAGLPAAESAAFDMTP